jgi:hypothetical protein
VWGEKVAAIQAAAEAEAASRASFKPQQPTMPTGCKQSATNKINRQPGK